MDVTMSGELVSMLGFLLLPMLSSITNHVSYIRYCSKSESNESRDDYLFALACSATCPENDRQSMQEMSMQDLFDRYVEDSKEDFEREEACPFCEKKYQTTTRLHKISTL
jgi:hypothetical protein